MASRLLSLVSYCNGRRLSYIVLSLALLMSCQPETPVPTATPTRTPVIPTATPTETPTPTLSPTPTLTPTPTPTLPPGLVLPPTPVIPEGWPPLPSNLYFLREGDLNIWLSEGEHVSSIPLPDEVANEDILAYRVSPGGQSIFYVTSGGSLYWFDRAAWSNTRLPTTGRLIHNDQAFLDVTPDASRLIYLAWGVQPTAEHQRMSLDSAGTLLAMDLNDPRQPQLELAFCEGEDGTPCGGFTMAPDGRALVMSDIRGIYLIALGAIDGDIERVEMLLPVATDGTDEILGWSPDSRWFVVAHHTTDGGGLTIFDIQLPDVQSYDLPLCSSPCEIDVGWHSSELWTAISYADNGCLFNYVAGAPVPSSSGEVLCAAPSLHLHPTDVTVLKGGGIAFLHRGSSALSSGLYLYRLDIGDLTPIALLPDTVDRMIWSEAGAAFIGFNANGNPQSLGWIDHGIFLDVTTRLDAAVKLQWETEGDLAP